MKDEKEQTKPGNPITECTKKANPQADTGAREAEIDFLVYKLFGLSYDEVLVVDPETGITREEYQRE